MVMFDPTAREHGVIVNFLGVSKALKDSRPVKLLPGKWLNATFLTDMIKENENGQNLGVAFNNLTHENKTLEILLTVFEGKRGYTKFLMVYHSSGTQLLEGAYALFFPLLL